MVLKCLRKYSNIILELFYSMVRGSRLRTITFGK